MNCDCRKKIEAQIKEAAGSIPDLKGRKADRVEICGYGLTLEGNALKGALFIPVDIHHEPIGRKAKTTTSVIAEYCPFCGIPLGDGKEPPSPSWERLARDVLEEAFLLADDCNTRGRGDSSEEVEALGEAMCSLGVLRKDDDGHGFVPAGRAG